MSPPDPSQPDLGQRVSTHKGSLGAGGWGWYVGALCILSSAFWVFAAFKSAVLGGEGNALEQVSTGACSFVVGAIMLLVPLRRLLQTIDIHEHGFVLKQVFGQKTVPRADVGQVNRTTHRRRRRTPIDEIVVALKSGGRVRMVGMADSEQITTLLHSWVGGGVPAAPSPGGWSPPGGGHPPAGGAPPAGGGWTPPASGGGWTPPASGGGWTPPGSGDPPTGGGWTPPT